MSQGGTGRVNSVRPYFWMSRVLSLSSAGVAGVAFYGAAGLEGSRSSLDTSNSS